MADGLPDAIKPSAKRECVLRLKSFFGPFFSKKGQKSPVKKELTPVRSGGWKPFWAALGAALLLFLPLAGGTVLLSRHQARARVQAAESQSGVAVQVPRADDQLTVLVCVADETPAFVLMYCNAEQNCLRLMSVPGALEVPFGSGEAALSECYAAAGPARCREALSEIVPLPEDARYLALSPATLEQTAQGFAALRVSFAGALQPEELAQAGLSAEVRELSAGAARELLGQMADAGLSPAACAQARAAVWDAFFRQNLELLPTRLPAALRTASSALLTDFTAQDYARLEETLEFLANGGAPVWSAALPVEQDEDGTYRAADTARAAVQALFNVTPTEPQAESAREP